MKKVKNKFIQNIKESFLSFYKTFFSSIKTFLIHTYRSLKASTLLALRNPKSFLSQSIRFIFLWWKRLVIGVVSFLIILYPILGFMSEEIDDNANFSGKAVSSSQMQSVQTAEALIHREVIQHGWKANLPIVFPSSILDNMPSYQMGIIEALQAFTGAFHDEKLQRSSEMLSYSGDTWYLNFSSYLKPMKPAQRVYRKAMALLRSYNEDLQEGKKAPLTVQNLKSILNAMCQDLSESLVSIDEQLLKISVIDFEADNVFYNTKGKLYADALLMRDLKKDYVKLIETPEIEISFNDAIDALIRAYQYNPCIILNGKVDGLLVPSHLAVQGYYTGQAINRLQELQNLLNLRNEE